MINLVKTESEQVTDRQSVLQKNHEHDWLLDRKEGIKKEFFLEDWAYLDGIITEDHIEHRRIEELVPKSCGSVPNLHQNQRTLVKKE